MRVILFLSFSLLLGACSFDGQANSSGQQAILPTPDPNRPSAPQAAIPKAGTNPRVAVEENPRYGLTLGFDAILPVYEPTFISADQADLPGEALIIGAAWGGEAKAYPISVLHFREMVNDELAGVPTLVTW